MPRVEVMQKKLREVCYFLRQMGDIDERPGGDQENFEFLLSALLSASRSITSQIEKGTHGRWYKAWRNGRTLQEQELLQFMLDQRNAEVHADGAGVEVAVTWIPLSRLRQDSYSHQGYGFHASGIPGMPPPTIGINVPQFELGGKQVGAYKTCHDFVMVLKELVGAFGAAHPGA